MTDCMVRGCSASTGSSLHYLPKDPVLRQKWVDFIYKNRVAPGCVDRIRICSIHFTEECFTNYRQKLMGFSKRLILRPTAVPTLDLQTDPAFAPNPQEEITARESDKVPLWLCPLCQQGKRNRHNLALHLTKKHSVLPGCLMKLLDAAAPVTVSSDEEGESSSQDINGTTHSKFLGIAKPSLVKSQNKDDSGVPVEQEGSVQNNPVGKNNYTETVVGHGDSGLFYINSDKDNTESDSNQVFKCEFCLEYFQTKSELSAHSSSASHFQKLKTRLGNADSMHALLRRCVSYKPYQCDVCNVAYNHAITLESHLKSVLHQTRARSAAKAAKSKSNSSGKKVTTKTSTNTFASAAHLPTPLTPAQALSAYLPVLTFTPSSIVPSVFASPSTPSCNFLPPSQMHLAKRPTSETPKKYSKPPKALKKAVPVFRNRLLKKTHLPHGMSGSRSHSSSKGNLTPEPSAENCREKTIEAVAVKVKVEIKEEPCEQEVSLNMEDSPTVDSMQTEQEYKAVKYEEESDEAMFFHYNEHHEDRNVVENQTGVKSNKNSNGICQISIESSPEPSSAKCSPSLMNPAKGTKSHLSLSSGPPVLNEFQSQVLRAFLESRDETHSSSLSKEDCEALGREVGLTGTEVQRWLVDARRVKDGAERIDHLNDGGQSLRSSTVFLSEDEDLSDQTVKGKKSKRKVIKEKPGCKRRSRKLIVKFC